MSAGRDEGVTTISALRDRADALHRAGRLDDALAIFAEADLAASATEPERLGMLLRQGKLLTDQVFYADRGYDEAVATLDAARTLAERLGDALAAATALDLLGLADY